MTISPGTRLGPYEILARVGAGGMGEVYKARDTRLDRTVAVKVIAGMIGGSPEIRQRFEREARSLSALNHPHICTIHDVGTDGDVEYLVLEYVEGQTLAARLERGPLPLEEVLRRGTELADVLDRAHHAGVIHRDLKPANIMLTKSGVKVLDFGLARLNVRPAAGGESVLTRGPGLTGEGAILGTLQYMSPEQLSGREVDARGDIFSLGAVLYEMATGRRAFEAPSQAGLIAAILEREPPPMAMPPASTGAAPALERIIRRCLAKDPDDRWQSARDIVLELRTLAAPAGAPAAEPVPAPVPPGRQRTPWLVAAAALTLAAVMTTVAAWYARRPAAEAPELRLQIVTPGGPTPTSLQLSPDGRRIVFIASRPDSTQQPELWVRELDTVVNQRLVGTEGASFPFWSADSRSIAFFKDSKLQRYDLAGGGLQALAPAPLGRGGTWNRDGVIVFAASVGALSRVDASGGTPVAPLTSVSPPHEASHRFPEFLPDGNRFIYYVQGSTEVQGIYLASLDQPKGRRLVATEARGALAGPDVLLFARQGTLFGQRFDVAAGSLIGEPIKLTDQVQFDGALNNIGASASSTGLIAYRVGSPSELLWVDRTGRTLGTVALPDPAPQNCPEISRDDRQVAFDRTIGGNRDIWVAELARGVTRRVTTDSGIDATPVWSPDGTRIAFRSNRSSVNQIYVKPASGTGTEERLPLSDLGVGVSDWVGRTLLFALLDPSTGLDLWAYPFDTGKPFAVAKSGFEERDGQLSTDGRWLAFASNETGRMEVYVQAFPQAGEKWQVSTNGGMQPRWRRDGRELFFVGANGAMMGATVSTRQDGTPIVTGAPVTLFATRLSTVQGGLLRHQYAVTADGQRFLLNSVAEGAATAPITIVVNWHGLHAGP